MTEDPKSPTPPDAAEPPRRPDAAPPAPRPDDEFEEVDPYTAEMTCKCGKKLAANAWFCPRCGRAFLLNMLFALVVLATGFAILSQIVQWLIGFVSRVKH